MQGGGHVRGWLVSDRSTQDRVAQSLRRLLPTAAGDAMLYALGDGNHSVAAAKEVWEETGRSAPERGGDHPARHVLVELVNVHDEGMTLEPLQETPGRIVLHIAPVVGPLPVPVPEVEHPIRS